MIKSRTFCRDFTNMVLHKYDIDNVREQSTRKLVVGSLHYFIVCWTNLYPTIALACVNWEEATSKTKERAVRCRWNFGIITDYCPAFVTLNKSIYIKCMAVKLRNNRTYKNCINNCMRKLSLFVNSYCFPYQKNLQDQRLMSTRWSRSWAEVPVFAWLDTSLKWRSL